MRKSTWILVGLISFIFLPCNGDAWKAACHDPIFPTCYATFHNCPATCPRSCEIDCRLCKPICPCDKPGAVCQDPRFIGGDGILFYFHGRKDHQFCLASDHELHINAHFIGKKSKKGRDFTWVQSIAVLFGPHQFYFGAQNLTKSWILKENQVRQSGDVFIAPECALELLARYCSKANFSPVIAS